MEGGVEVAAEVSVISPPQALSGVYTLQPRSHFFSSSSSRNASPPSLPHASQDPSGLLASDPQQLQETDQQGETTARRRLLQQYPSRNEPASSSSPPAIIYALNFLLPTANGGDPSTSQVTHEGGTSTDRQKQQPCLSHPSLLPSASSSSSSFLYPSGPLKPPHHHMGESVYYDTGRSYPSAQSMGSSSYQRADASSSGALPSIRPSLYQEKSSYAPSLGGRVASSSSLPLPYPAGSTASPSRGRMPTSGGMGCPSLYPSPPQQPFPSRPRGASSVSSSSSIPPYSSISCLPSQPLPCSSLPRGGSSARLVRTSQPTNYEVSQSSSSSHLSPSLSSLRHHPAGAPGGLLQPNLTTAAGVGNETHEGSGADDSRRYSSSSSTATSTFPQQTCEVPVSSSSCSPSMDRVVSVPPRHLLSSASSLSLLPTGRLHEPASSSSSHQRMGDVHTESISGREEVPLPPYTTYDPSHSSTASASSSSPSSSSYPLPLPPGGQVVAEVSYEAKHRRLFENLPLGTSDLSGLPLLYVRRYPTASHAASSPSQPPLQAEGGDGDMGEGQRILQGRGTTSEEEMQRQMEEKIQGLNRNEEDRRRFEQEQLIEEENTRRRTRSYSLISRPVSSCGNVLQGENLVHFPLSNQTGSSHLLHHPLLPSSGHPGGKTGLLPPGGVYTPGNGMGGGLQNSSFSPPLHQSAVYSPPFEKDGRQISSSSSFSVSLEQRQREDEGLRLAIAPLVRPGEGERLPQPISPTSCHSGFLLQQGDPSSSSSQHYPQQVEEDGQLPCDFYCNTIPRPPPDVYPPPLQLRQQLLLQRQYQTHLLQENESGESRERETNPLRGGIDPMSSSTSREFYGETRGINPHHPGNHTVEGLSTRRRLIDEEEERRSRGMSINASQRSSGVFSLEETLRPFYGLRNELSSRDPQPPLPPRYRGHSMTRETGLQSSLPRGREGEEGRESDFPKISSSLDQRGGIDVSSARRTLLPRAGMNTDVFRGSMSLPPPVRTWASSLQNLRGETEWQGESMDCEKTLKPLPHPSHQHTPFAPPLPSCSSSSTARISSSSSSRVSCVVVANDSHQEQQRVNLHRPSPSSGLAPPSLPLLSSPAPHPPLRQHRRKQLVPPHEHHETREGGEEEESIPHPSSHPPREEHNGLTRGARREDEPLLHPTQDTAMRLSEKHPVDVSRSYEEQTAEQQERGGLPPSCERGKDFSPDPHHRYAFLDREDHRHLSHLDRERERDHELTPLQSSPNRRHFLLNEEGRASSVITQKSFDYQQMVQSLEKTEKKEEEVGLLVEAEKTIKKDDEDMGYPSKTHESRGISTLTTTTAPPAPFDILRGVSGLGVGGLSDDFFTTSQPLQRHPYTSNTYHASPHTQQRPALSSAAAAPSSSPPPPSDSLICETGEERGRDGHHQSSRHSSRRASKGGEEEEEREGYFSSFPSFHQEKERMISAAREGQDHRRKAGRGDGGGDCREEEEEEGGGIDSSWKRRTSLEGDFFLTTHGKGRGEESGIEQGDLDACSSSSLLIPSTSRLLQDPSTAARFLPNPRGSRRMGASDRLDSSSSCSRVQPSSLEEKKISSSVLDSSRGTASSRSSSSGTEERMASLQRRQMGERGGVISRVHTPGDENSPPFLPRPSISSNINKTSSGGNLGGAGIAYNPCLPSPAPSSPPRLVKNHYLTEPSPCNRSPEEEAEGKEQAGGGGGEGQEDGLFSLRPSMSSSFSSVLIERERHKKKLLSPTQTSIPHPNLSGDVGMTPSIPPVVPLVSRPSLVNANSIPSSSSYQRLTRISSSSSSYRPSPVHHTTTNTSKACQSFLFEKSRFPASTTRSFSHKDRQEDPMSCNEKSQGKQTKGISSTVISYQSAYPSHLSTMTSLSRSGEILPEPRPRSRGGEPSYSYPTALQPPSSSSSGRFKKLSSRKTSQEEDDPYQECPRLSFPLSSRDLQTPPSLSPSPSPSLPALSSSMVEARNSSLIERKDDMALNLGERKGGETGISSPTPVVSNALPSKHISSSNGSSRSNSVTLHSHNSSTQSKVSGGGGGANQGNAEGLLLLDVQPSERLPRKMKERKEGDEKNRLMDAPEQGEKREFELSTISVYLEEREKMIDITSKGLPPLPSSSMWRHAMKPSTGSGRGDEKTAERSSLRQKRREQEEEHLEVVEAERGAPERRERREIENEEKITQGKEKMTRKEENCLPTKEKESERNREVPHEVSKERRSLFGKEEEEDEKVEESISSSYPLEPIMEPSRSLSPPRSRRGRVSRCLSPLSRRGSSPSAFPSSIHAFYEEILSTPQLSIDPTKGECLPLLNTSERHPIAMDLSLPPSGERTSKSFTPYDREGEEVKGEQACAMTQSRDLLNTSLEDEGRSQMSRADEKERREAGKQEEEAKERRGSVSSSDGRKGRKIEMLWEPQRSSLPLQRRPLTPPHPHHPFDQDDVNHEALARSRTTLETKKKEKNGEKERRKETHGEISSNKENPLTSTPEPQQQFYVSFPISPPSRHGAMDERDQVAEVLIEEDKSKKKKQVKPEKEENLSDDGGEEIEKKECCSQRGEQGDCPRKCDDLLLISFSLDGDKSEVVVPGVCTPRIPEDKKRATPVRNVEGERVLESDLLKSRSRGGRREGSPELVEEIVLLEQNEEEEDDSPFFSPRITLTTPPKSQPPPAPSHVHHEVSNAPFHEGETCPNVPSLSFVSSENNLDSSISQKTLAPCQQQEQQPTAFPISSDSPPHLIPTSLPPIPHPLISQSSSDVSKHGTLSEYFSQTEHHSACLPIEEPFPSSTSLPVSGGEGREKEEEKNERRSRQVDGEMQHQEGDFNLISQTSSYDRVSRLGAIHYTVDVDEDLMTTLHIRRQEEKDSKRKDEKEGEGEEENGWIVKGRFLDAASVDISTTMPSPTALVGGGGDRSRRRPHRGGREHRRREEDERGEGERESLSLIEREEEEEEELYSSPVETSLASPSRVEGRKRGDTMYYSIQEEKCFFVDMSKEIDHTNRLPKNDLKMNLTASQASSRRVEEEEKRHREIEAEEGKNGTQHLKLPHSNDKKEEQDKTLLNDRDSLQSKSSSSLHPRMKDLAEPEGSRQSHVHLHEMETSTMLVDSSSHSLPPAASITQTTAAIAAASIVRAVRAAQREETVECLQAGKLAVAAAAATAAASGTAHSEEISLRRPTLGGRERREERGDDKEDIAKEEKQKDEKEERERTVSEREIEDSHTPRYRPRIIPRTRNVGNEEERENGERTSFEQQSRRGSIGSVEETRRSTREGGERRNSTSLHERETDRKTMYMSCEGTSVHGPKPVEEDVSTVTYGVSEKCVDTRGDVVACLLSRDKKLERGETPEYRNTCRSLPCSISHENEYDMVNQSHYSEAKSSEKNVCRSIPCSFEETAMSLRPREVVSDDGEEEERIEVLHSDEDETPMWREGTNSHSRPSNRIDENRRRGEQEGQEGQERFLSLPQPTSTKTLVQRGGGGGGKREKILDEETRHDTMRDGENARMGGGGSKSWEKLNMRNLTVSTDDANELDDGIQGGSGKMMVPTTTGPGGEGGRLFSLDAKKEKKSFLYDEEEEEDNNGIEDIYHEEQRKGHSTRLSRNLPSGTG
ncbi:hypothetical protein CSUI_006652 [Cystoisospora suis]|uniref:Uncharacterized protein n=1 Tax=Cystoisospora suis TaxID=483139 RepID=A0A2C6KPP1_9APIC|nr:hypothetical protein CSUI_006652 [Cystoisospora suis]